MSATVILCETNGPLASAVETEDISNLNFGSDDSPELDPATYPVTAGADSHSYEKWLRLKVTAMGDTTILDNIKVWKSSGAFKTDEGISTNLVTVGYTAPSYPVGGPINTNSTAATVAVPTSEPASANVGIGGSLGGTITVPGYSNFFILQLDVSASTPTGAVNQKVITIQWDEQ